MAADKTGTIAFFTTYRPPVPLDIYSCQVEPLEPKPDEFSMTDGKSYNYNGQMILPAALKTLLRRSELASYEGTEADVDSGRLSGMIFVSERGNLETLHIALRLGDNSKPKVFSLAEVLGKSEFSGVRMEDSGCIAGDYLIYITTKDDPSEEDPPRRRQPWTAVYWTNLKTGETERITLSGKSDLSPSVSPSGKQLLVATFGRKGWNGEIEDLQTDIYLIDLEKKSPFYRKSVVKNGGWPTWGSDNVIFFHRKDSPKNPREKEKENWGVYRLDISNRSNKPLRVTPEDIDAITPAAISDTKVAVATIRKKSSLETTRIRGEDQYRHIEIFDTTLGQKGTGITQRIRPRADHFNPFVIDDGKRIGYHRCKNDLALEKQSQTLDCPLNGVELFRASGVFPTFNHDGSKLAFVDNEFKVLWVASDKGLQVAHRAKGPNRVFSPVWNKAKDIIYICEGPSFSATDEVVINSIECEESDSNDSDDGESQSAFSLPKQLTYSTTTDPDGKMIPCNSAFPSTNKEGTKFVFRSKRKNGFKNLYIMEDAKAGEIEGSEARPLTGGTWTDTHCQWSPNGDWIVFSSSRDKPPHEPDGELDAGYFAVYLVHWKNPDVTKAVRVMASANASNHFIGHVNHPFFSPDGKSIVVASDLAAVSVDPISMPLFVHSVRPYGDIFTFDIDTDEIKNNEDLTKFTRITHSRYENSTATWTKRETKDPNALWDMVKYKGRPVRPSCPYQHGDGVESWHMSGHLCIFANRCC